MMSVTFSTDVTFITTLIICNGIYMYKFTIFLLYNYPITVFDLVLYSRIILSLHRKIRSFQ